MNYKVRVNNDVEAEEAIEFFKKLGFGTVLKTSSKIGFVAYEEKDIYAERVVHWEQYIGNEISLTQLKDLVSSNGKKEYLELQQDGTYKLVMRGSNCLNSDIEVPEGAIRLTIGIEQFIFWNDKDESVLADSFNSFRKGDGYDKYCSNFKRTMRVLWQRHEQPVAIEGSGDYTPLGCNVNHPSHYTSDPSGIECIEVTRHRNFNIGNAIKYLWRNGLKDSDAQIQDLEKSIWYIQDEIKRLQSL
jgi:hypothetical protein